MFSTDHMEGISTDQTSTSNLHVGNANSDASTPTLLDKQRAAIASACTYHEASWCGPRLQQQNDPSLCFTKVIFADHKGMMGVHNMVMALVDAGDEGTTLFVALPGTKTFADWLLDLDIRHRSFTTDMGFQRGGVCGRYHAGFCRRLDEILPNMLRLEEYMQGHVNRLVFCGHSLGGALAHLAFIQFMMSMHSQRAHSYNPISIAFGSPHFCDAEAKDFLDRTGLGNRMFTYINKDDPVPRVLDDINRTRQKAIKYLFKTLVPDWFHVSNWCIPSTPSTDDNGRTFLASKAEFGTLWIAFVTILLDPNRASRYVAAGQHHPVDPEYPGERTIIITHSSIQCHNIGAYVQQLLQIQIPKDHPHRQILGKCHVDVVSIAPHIRSCIMIFRGKHEAKKQAKIIVKGNNLLMLKKYSVSIRGSQQWHGDSILRWSLAQCSNSELTLNLENEVDAGMIAFLTNGDRPDGALSLSITTCFGKSEQMRVQTQDPWFDSCTKCVTSCTVAKLVLMKNCGLLANEIGQEPLSNYFPKGLIDHINKSSSEDLSHSVRLAWDEFLSPLVGKLMEAVDIPKSTLIKYRRSCLFPRSEERSTYYDCLQFLFKCLTKQTQNADQNENIGKEAFFYEKQIYALWESSELPIDGERADSRGGSWARIPQEFRIKLVEKGKIIHSLFLAHEKLGKLKTVIFVGPRFAGKSTLINCLLGEEVAGGVRREMLEEEERQKQSTGMPKAVAQAAGARVESFIMRNIGNADQPPILLVEVPGVFGKEQRWQHLVHLADLVVVVVSFAGETAEPAAELSEGARRDGQCNNIVVVVNGMDKILHGKEEAEAWKKYPPAHLAEHRNQYSKRSGVPTEDVLMSVAFNTDDQLETTTIEKLRKRDILFRREITEALRDRISKLHNHDHDTAAREQRLDQLDCTGMWISQ